MKQRAIDWSTESTNLIQELVNCEIKPGAWNESIKATWMLMNQILKIFEKSWTKLTVIII